MSSPRPGVSKRFKQSFSQLPPGQEGKNHLPGAFLLLVLLRQGGKAGADCHQGQGADASVGINLLQEGLQLPPVRKAVQQQHPAPVQVEAFSGGKLQVGYRLGKGFSRSGAALPAFFLAPQVGEGFCPDLVSPVLLPGYRHRCYNGPLAQVLPAGASPQG